jgi:hypothetical protein
MWIRWKESVIERELYRYSGNGKDSFERGVFFLLLSRFKSGAVATMSTLLSNRYQCKPEVEDSCSILEINKNKGLSA